MLKFKGRSMKAIVMACLWMLGITFAGAVAAAAAESNDTVLTDTDNLVFETIEWP
jgi:hypothetical protein